MLETTEYKYAGNAGNAGNQELFLIKPGKGYNWGVSRSREATWGYIRSANETLCPEAAGPWMVYDEDMLRWILDVTLRVVCVGQ